MFREMRRKEKAMDLEAIDKILREGDYGVLSCLGENGYPYGVPLNYVYKDQSIYIHSAGEGYKLDNIGYNEKVSFTIVNYYKIRDRDFDTSYDSVIVFGRGRPVEAGEKRQALEALISKYSKDYMEAGHSYIDRSMDQVVVVKIEIDHKSGKKGR